MDPIKLVLLKTFLPVESSEPRRRALAISIVVAAVAVAAVAVASSWRWRMAFTWQITCHYTSEDPSVAVLVGGECDDHEKASEDTRSTFFFKIY